MTEVLGRSTTGLVVRPLRDDDEVLLRQLFSATMVMGTPLPFDLRDKGRYASLCLDWYLDQGRADAAVVDADGEVVGFTLVCTDQAAFDRWVRPRAARYAAYSVMTLARTNPRSPLARFHRTRLRDGWALWRSPPPPFPAHAHVNVVQSGLAGWAGLELLAWIDQRCAAAGVPGWFGEINAPVGRRAMALARVVGPVVHRAPNRTLSWLLDRPVERLTVTRELAAPGTGSS